MALNIIVDLQKLMVDGNDNSSPYQDVTKFDINKIYCFCIYNLLIL